MFERLHHHDRLDMPLRRNGRFAKGKFLKWYENQERLADHPIRETVKRFAGRTAFIAAGASLIAGQIDIAHNKQVQAEADIDIAIVSEALNPEYNDHSIVILSGYGYLNADYLTKKLGPSIQPTIDGQLWSVDYDNASLDATAIANQIITTAEQQNVDTITIVGHSIGGIIAAQVSTILSEQSEIRVQALIPISTPDGYEGLRPWKQDQLNLTGLLHVFPDLVYSTPFQLGTELIFRHDSYDDGNLTDRTVNFFQTAGTVWDRVMNRKLPGNWLINDQVLTLQNAQLGQQFNQISDAPGNILKPVIIYIGTEGYDVSVNDELSAQNLSSDADNANLRFIHLTVPGLAHDTPWDSAEEFTTTLQDAAPQIQDALDANQRTFNINNPMIITRLPG